VCFGQSSGPIVDFKFTDLVANGSLYATRPTLFDYIKTPEELQARAADLFAKVASGVVKAHIGQRLSLRDAAQAHRDLEARAHHRLDGAAALKRERCCDARSNPQWQCGRFFDDGDGDRRIDRAHAGDARTDSRIETLRRL